MILKFTCLSLSVSNANVSLEKLEHCVSVWITMSKLKLSGKTELLLIGSKLQREKIFN